MMLNSFTTKPFLMLLIALDAAGSDLPSLPAPFLSMHCQLMLEFLVKCAGFRNFSHYSLNM